MAQVQKIDSNVTGLRFAEEESIGVLPGSGVTWFPLEPNSYDNFGGEISTVARNPINASRQRQKGVTVDLDASGGFQSDLTQSNLEDILQGFFFADLRRKAETAFNEVPVIDVDGAAEEYTLSNLEATAVDSVAVGGSGYAEGDTITLAGGTSTTQTVLTVDSVSGGAVTAASITTPGRYSVAPTDPVAQDTTSGGGTGATFNMTYSAVVTFQVGDLIEAANFSDAANNGLKRITAVATDTVLTVAEDLVTDASPASTAGLTTVGFQMGTAELDVDVSGSLPKLVRASGTVDFTTFGLIPGEWIFIGGDVASSSFTNSENNGFARVKSVSTTEIVLDKTQQTMVAETGTGLTIRLFFGRVLKNESDPSLIKRRTYQLERTLGVPDDSNPNQTQAEYLVGSVANQLTFNFNTADKITADLSFVSTDNEQRTAATGVKPGTRPALSSEDAFNTSNDFSRLKMSILEPADSNPSRLFAFLTEFTLSINNNVSPNKAISVLGAFEVAAGQFNVDGNATAYFSTVEAVQAVRNNEDVTLDFIMAKANQGVAVDVPLIALGDARLNVEQDQPITLPLNTPAAADRNFNHTLLMVFFDYLPSAAEA